MDAAAFGDELRVIQEQLDLNAPALREFLTHNLPLLNVDQRVAYDSILLAMEGDRGGCSFIDGPGGTSVATT